jgi:hypothetical protein
MCGSWRAISPGHKKRMFLRNPGSDVRFPHVPEPERSYTVRIDTSNLAHDLKSEGYGARLNSLVLHRSSGRIY